MPAAPLPLKAIYISARLKDRLKTLSDQKKVPLNRMTESLLITVIEASERNVYGDITGISCVVLDPISEE